MAQWILEHLDQCDATEMFHGITWFSGLARWRRSDERTPDSLLRAIDKSSIDGDSESRFEIHRIDLAKHGEQAQDVTWVRAEE